jgi:hypothetical protein
MSGFAGDTLERHDVRGVERLFIQKPFTPEALRSKVAQVFGETPEAAHSDSGVPPNLLVSP